MYCTCFYCLFNKYNVQLSSKEDFAIINYGVNLKTFTLQRTAIGKKELEHVSHTHTNLQKWQQILAIDFKQIISANQ